MTVAAGGEAAMAQGQWTEVEARGFLEALRKSRQGIYEFCQERGIVPQRLYYWRRRLGEANDVVAESDPEDAGLVPVEVVDRSSGKRCERGEPVTVLLRGGQMLKVGRGFDEAAFIRVVTLLDGV
jgi:hypothetical protein